MKDKLKKIISDFDFKLYGSMILVLVILTIIIMVLFKIDPPVTNQDIDVKLNTLQTQIQTLEKKIDKVSKETEDIQAKYENLVNPLEVYMGKQQDLYMEGVK